jgi:hypothetical protein
MDRRKAILGKLVDSQKRLAAVLGHAHEIIKTADRLEEEAQSDVRRLRRVLHILHNAEGPRRDITEAEYLEALDRRRRAGQAGTLARRTLVRH